MSIDWKDIRSYEGSQNTAFEEVVCQLAYNELKNSGDYVRVKAPDGGVESYLILEDGKEIGWQAKYFFDIQDSQFAQIKKSFKKALETHPKLVKYIVCCPIDKQDPRIPNKKHLQDRWIDFVEECKTIAEADNRIVEIEFWGAFELNNKLQNPENSGMLKFWFNKDDFSESWFKDQVNVSIKNLGARYSAELNVDIHEIAQTFDMVLRNQNSKLDLFGKLDAICTSLNHIKDISRKHQLNCESEIEKIIQKLNTLWSAISMRPNHLVPFAEISQQVNAIVKNLTQSIDQINDRNEQSYFRNNLYKLTDSINAISDKTFNLFNLPYLVVWGDAGTGKSHLLGDLADSLITNNKKCIFILGQRLTETTNPWTQILKNELRLDCNEDTFLGVLNSIGQAQNERVPIIIDAMNEGKGRQFWRDTLAGFIEKVKKYPWVGLVLAVRSEYKAEILSNIKSDIQTNIVTTQKHNGFAYNIFEAIQSFFSHYNLALPTEPLLINEFTNPLFLKIYCKYRQNTRIDDFEIIITDIFDSYFGSINDELSKNLGYRKSLNYVKKVLTHIAELIFLSDGISVSYETAMESIQTIIPNLNADSFLQNLISENLLISYEMKNEEVLFFAYERFYDYFSAQSICNQYDNLDDIKNRLSINDFDVIFENFRLNQGVLSILSFLIPTKFHVELFEILDGQYVSDHYFLGDAFIESLYWRDNNNLNVEKCKNFINENLFKDNNLYSKFINLMYIVAGKEKHPLNANNLYQWLSKSNLADRDSFWTTHISSGYFQDEPFITSLIDWAKKQDFSEILSDESRFLVAIAISWLFTSTNIQFRDNATIALTLLLQNRMEVANKLFDKFIGIDDPYILERVLASIYGALLASSSYEGIDNICSSLLSKIFNQTEVYPNILIRDYARNIIEFSNIHQLVEFNSDVLVSVRPPYNSLFPIILPTNQEIDAKYSNDYKDESIPKNRFAQDRILYSMTTEYGRGIGAYGDFGRYTFQSNFNNWENVDVDKLSNYAIQLIFEKYGYDSEKHGGFDRNIARSENRHEASIERIGKKYQWLAMYEVAARVADNFQMINPATQWNEDKQLVWYNGSVEPSFRDIDTSYTCPENKEIRFIEPPKYDDWGDDFEIWVVSSDNLPNSKNLITNIYENQEWFSLHRHYEFKPEKTLGEASHSSDYQRFWYMVEAYLVKNEDFETVIKNLENKNFMGQWMPQASDKYNDIFNLEYYWSPLLNIFENNYYGNYGWQNISGSRVGLKNQDLGQVHLCTENHIFEGNRNREIGYHISAPTELLFNTLRLKNDKVAGSWLNQNGELTMFDASQFGNKGGSNLVVKKESLQLLEKITDCRVVWTVLAEKIAMYKGHKSTEKRLDVSGIYYLENGSIKGKDFYFRT